MYQRQAIGEPVTGPETPPLCRRHRVVVILGVQAGDYFRSSRGAAGQLEYGRRSQIDLHGDLPQPVAIRAGDSAALEVLDPGAITTRRGADREQGPDSGQQVADLAGEADQIE